MRSRLVRLIASPNLLSCFLKSSQLCANEWLRPPLRLARCLLAPGRVPGPRCRPAASCRRRAPERAPAPFSACEFSPEVTPQDAGARRSIGAPSYQMLRERINLAGSRTLHAPSTLHLHAPGAPRRTHPPRTLHHAPSTWFLRKLQSRGFLFSKVSIYYLLNIPIDMDKRARRLDRVRTGS